MKKKNLNIKLKLNKQTITNLNMSKVKGGTAWSYYVGGCHEATFNSNLNACHTDNGMCTNSCEMPCQIAEHDRDYVPTFWC